MAALLTATEMRTHIETCLVDAALQRIIDAADAEIILRLGPLATSTEVVAGGEHYLHLTRKSTAIVSAVERTNTGIDGYEDTTLVATDYNLLDDGYRVERLATGTNQSITWLGQVSIVSTPVSDSARRVQLEIDLVKLAVKYDAISADKIADTSTTSLNYTQERERLFIGARKNRRLIQ